MLHFLLHRYMTSIEHLDDTNALQQLLRELSLSDPAKKIAAIHRTVLLKERAPRKQLLEALNHWRAAVRAAAAEAVEALQPWITDEQWLETLQENTGQIFFAALNILLSLGKDAPLRPLLSSVVLRNRSLRSSSQDILRLKIAQWSPEKQEQFIQLSSEQLQRGSFERRVIVLEMLGLMDDKVPLETFLAALNASEDMVRSTALEQLRKRGQQGSVLPIEPLANLLNASSAHIRQGSLLALGTQKEAVPIALLLAAMHDSDERVIHIATDILGSGKNILGIPALVEQLLADPDYCGMDDHEHAAFNALCELYAYVPIERLLKALSSEPEKVRTRAIMLLSCLQEKTPVELFLRLLDHKDPAIRKQVIFGLSHHLTRIPGDLPRNTLGEASTRERGGKGCDSSSFIAPLVGDCIREAIVNKLKDRKRAVRKAASLVLLSDNRDIPAELLLPLLDCPENIARATAIELLGKRTPMIRLIAATRDQKWTVRQAAIEVLGTMGEQVSLALFLEALGDRNLSVRTTALFALGEQGGRIPVPIIVAVLLHDRRRVSAVAGEILERLGKRVPRKSLLQALGDPKPYVRLMALHLLQAIGYEETFPVEMVRYMIQDSEVSVREAAILTLNQLGAIDPAEPFIAALDDSDSKVRKAALLVLAKLGERAPLEPLKVLLGDSELYPNIIVCLQKTHPEVLREVAEEASNILLGKGSGQVLGSLLQEHAAAVIGNMNNPGPLLVNRLFELLDWPCGSVRRKAEQALCKLGQDPSLKSEVPAPLSNECLV